MRARDLQRMHRARGRASTGSKASGAAFLKVPRKILGKLIISGATDTQVTTSPRGCSATVEHCTNRPETYQFCSAK